MYGKDKLFKSTYSNIIEFTKQIEDYVIFNQKVNPEEQLYRIYYSYKKGLRNIFIELKSCNKDMKSCINDFKINFDNLRSDTSRNIEKIKK